MFLGRDAREQEFKRLNIENVPLVWRGTVNDLKKLAEDNIEKLAKDYEDSVVYADKGVVYHAYIEGYKKAKNHIVNPDLNDLKK
jgi:hypothetical protein